MLKLSESEWACIAGEGEQGKEGTCSMSASCHAMASTDPPPPHPTVVPGGTQMQWQGEAKRRARPAGRLKLARGVQRRPAAGWLGQGSQREKEKGGKAADAGLGLRKQKARLDRFAPRCPVPRSGRSHSPGRLDISSCWFVGAGIVQRDGHDHECVTLTRMHTTIFVHAPVSHRNTPIELSSRWTCGEYFSSTNLSKVVHRYSF